MMAMVMIPLMIAGGFDGVEPPRCTRRTCAAFAGPVHRTTELRGLGAAARGTSESNAPAARSCGASMEKDTMKTRNPKARAAGVREIARLTGYSPAHVSYASRGMRISRPLRAKMRELGLKFKEVK